MSSVTIQEAQAHLAELINRLSPGEEIIVTRDDEPIAKLSRTESAPAKPIWEKVAEMVANVPPEELAKLPRDGAERHDFYIYGAESPK